MQYRVYGTALADAQYAALPLHAFIPAGRQSVRVVVNALEDDGDPGTITLRLKVVPNSRYTVGDAPNAVVRVINR